MFVVRQTGREVRDTSLSAEEHGELLPRERPCWSRRPQGGLSAALRHEGRVPGELYGCHQQPERPSTSLPDCQVLHRACQVSGAINLIRASHKFTLESYAGPFYSVRNRLQLEPLYIEYSTCGPNCNWSSDIECVLMQV